MKRKIIKQGAATLTISLPSKWTKRFNLKGGDEIEVEEQDLALVLSTEKSFSLNKRKINISNVKDLTYRILLRMYQEGYDEIEVVFNQPQLMNIIQRDMGQYIGFEIIKQGRNYCIIKDISGSLGIDFEGMLRRLFLLIKSMANDALEAINKNEKEILGNIEQRDFDINKFVGYCIRILNKKGHKDFRKTPTIYLIVTQLEEISDEFKELNRLIFDNNIKLNKMIKDLYREVIDFFNLCYEFTFNLKIEKAAAIGAKRMELLEKINTLKNIDNNQIKCVYILRNIINLSSVIHACQLSYIKDI